LDSNTRCRSHFAAVAADGGVLGAVTDGLPGEYHYPGPWAGDGSSFFVLTTDADQDHVSLARFCVDDRTLPIVDGPGWDVEDIVASADGRTVVWSVNEDGYSELHAMRDGARWQCRRCPTA
jgi:hypothetical protein